MENKAGFTDHHFFTNEKEERFSNGCGNKVFCHRWENYAFIQKSEPISIENFKEGLP
jgi:hypothetical protein